MSAARNILCDVAGKKKTKSIVETHPEVARLSNGWDPALFTAGSGRKLSWKCHQGHVWEATIANLVRTGNCPYCIGAKTLKGFNDLGTTNPELAEEAIGWDPTKFRPGSGKKVKWRCKQNHQWEATILSRSQGSGCGFCSGRHVVPGKSDLFTTHSELAKEAFGWDPRLFSEGSGEMQKWKCGYGHIWEAVISSRALRGSGCGVCSGRKTLIGFNDLATEYPLIASELINLDPKDLYARSEKKVDWKCRNGHSWSATVVNRTKNGSGCPFCAGQKAITGETDMATTNPELAKEAYGWDPTTYSIGSGVNLEWICKFGHRFKATPVHRKRGDGCNICSGHNLSVGDNDLKTTNPALAKEAFGWDPKTVTKGHNKKKTWKCALGHTWSAVVGSRATGVGCPTCSGKIALEGFNDLQTTHPALAKQAHGWDPKVVTSGSSKSMLWRCELGHIWKATIGNRRRTLHCPTCIGRTVLIGFNDLKTTHPSIANESFNWNPTTVTAGSSSKPREWICENNHRWKAKVSSRTAGHGCPSCAASGFDPNKKAWLYFAHHESLGLMQIGITNQLDQRLATHAKSGWELIEFRGPMNGAVTQEWETSILRALKKKGARFGGRKDKPGKNIPSDNSFGSESWVRASCDVTSIKQLMDWVHEDDLY
jgi:hypothetical protein